MSTLDKPIGIYYTTNMDKKLEPVKNETKPLLAVEAPVRAELLKELPKKERDKTVVNLIEAAMTLGLLDAYEIRKWLGLNRYNIRTITSVRDSIKERWLDDSQDIIEYAKTQRAVQIAKAWSVVRECEDMYGGAKTTNDKIKVKQLQLQWMQHISKLSFIDKMVGETDSPVAINLVPGSNVSIEEKKDG